MMNSHPYRYSGILLGLAAILLWSLSSVGLVAIGRDLGPWQLLAFAAPASAVLQLAGYRAIGFSLVRIMRPPAKLWLAIGGGFVVQLIVFTIGIMVAGSQSQAVGVSLLNYLWPTLTILFTIWLVPGERLTLRLILALLLALTGVVLANFHQLQSAERLSLWPYACGITAAITWALYSSIIIRWCHWAKEYATSPLGFLVAGLIGLTVVALQGSWPAWEWRTVVLVLFYTVGPWGGGYLLWELALTRSSGVTLGLMASLIPLLSTGAMLLYFMAIAPGKTERGELATLMAAALLIALAVALGRAPRLTGRRKRPATAPLAQ